MKHPVGTPSKSGNLQMICFSAALLAIANVLTLLPTGIHARLIGSAIIFCFLPGFLLIAWLLASATSGKRCFPLLEVILLGSAASYLLTTMVTLLLGYLPMALPYYVLLVALDIITLILLYLNYRSGTKLQLPPLPQTSSDLIVLVVLVLIVLLAVFLRFGNLGYAEYLGDEAEVVYRTRQVILGNQEELFLQRKGPVQIMMTAAFALGTNSFNELALRFPFALASVLSVVALYLLGASVWNNRIGLIGAGILAIDGIALGFSRLVQYQGVVLLTLVMIVYCLHRMAVETDRPVTSEAPDEGLSTRYLSLSLLAFGLALLTHYETVLIALPMAMIIYPQLPRRHNPRLPFFRSNLKELLISAAVVLVLLLVFYVPFVLHPHFGQTYDVYTYERIGFGRGEPFNNIKRYVASSIFYNSVYYVFITAVLWILGSVRILKETLPTRKFLAYVAALLVVTGALMSLLSPASLTVDGRALVFLFFAPVLVLSIPAFSKGYETERAVLVWLCANFMAYAFFIRVPGLHYYTMAPAAALVAAVGLDWLSKKGGLYVQLGHLGTGRWLGWGVVGLGFIVMAGYLCLAFVRTNPPYAIDFPEHRSDLYWTPQDVIPQGGFFGFPRHSGWKALSVLYRQGELRGTYMSNKKQIKPEWTYMRNPVKADQDPRYFFYDTLSARLTQKEKYPLEWVEENFRLMGHVRVDGNERIHIFERTGDTGDPEMHYYDAEYYETSFDQIDWLSEYRRAAEYGLDESDVAQASLYLMAQGQPQSLVILNDPVLEDAMHYHYAGPAETTALPQASDMHSLTDEAVQVFLVVWDGVNEPETEKISRWLDEPFDRVAENAFGNLKVVTFEPQG